MSDYMTEEDMRVSIEYSLEGLIKARTLMLVALAVKSGGPRMADAQTMKELVDITEDEILEFVRDLDDVISNGRSLMLEENTTGFSFDEPSLELDDE